MRIGMGCKAQTTDIALAMARICNAADRPRPRLHTREEIVNTFLHKHPIKKELLALGYSAFQGLNALKHNEYQRKQLFLKRGFAGLKLT